MACVESVARHSEHIHAYMHLQVCMRACVHGCMWACCRMFTSSCNAACIVQPASVQRLPMKDTCNISAQDGSAALKVRGSTRWTRIPAAMLPAALPWVLHSSTDGALSRTHSKSTNE